MQEILASLALSRVENGNQTLYDTIKRSTIMDPKKPLLTVKHSWK